MKVKISDENSSNNMSRYKLCVCVYVLNDLYFQM